MKLVEQCAGVGAIRWADRHAAKVAYRVDRYQGMTTSGLPVPGLHRIEGSVALASLADGRPNVGDSLTLELEDGRALALTLADAEGRVLAEGHGPTRGCSCC